MACILYSLYSLNPAGLYVYGKFSGQEPATPKGSNTYQHLPFYNHSMPLAFDNIYQLPDSKNQFNFD